MLLNFSQVDTTPGNEAKCSFSPPAGWEGDGANYMSLMRSRYRDLMHRQRMVVTARFSRVRRIEFSGHFAKEAAEIIDTLKLG